MQDRLLGLDRRDCWAGSAVGWDELRSSASDDAGESAEAHDAYAHADMVDNDRLELPILSVNKR